MQTQCRELIAIGVDCHSNTDSAEYGESLSSATADSPLQVPPSLALAARAKMRAVGWEYEPSVPSTPQSPALSYGSAYTTNSRRGYNQPLPPLPFPECCFHKALVDRLEFIEPPRVTDAGVGLIRGACFRLFIGQIKFETTAAEMRWLIHYLTGVSPLKVEVRGMGCCMAYFETYEEIQQVCALRARLLFDHTGVWFARTEEQQALLHRYVAYYVSQIGRGFRLPKDMCVLEEERFQFIPALPQGCHFEPLNAGWPRAGGRPPLPPRQGTCSGAETHFDAEHLW